jgi:hypothetical protein
VVIIVRTRDQSELTRLWGCLYNFDIAFSGIYSKLITA